MKPDVIVVGVGRTGTSTVARILHEYFKVCMGHDFFPMSKAQPDGTYESILMNRTSKRLFNEEGFDVEEWLGYYGKMHRHCGSRVHGVKAPDLALLTLAQVNELEPTLVVRTWRPKVPTVDSLEKWRPGRTRQQWAKFYDEREWAMRRGVDRYRWLVRVDFNRLLTDYEVLSKLVKHMRDVTKLLQNLK